MDLSSASPRAALAVLPRTLLAALLGTLGLSGPGCGGDSSPPPPDLAATDAAMPPVPPAFTAPPLDRTVATTVYDASRFLYTGPDAIQTGVAPGTIRPRQAAVLRGRITGVDQKPLPGVAVTVLRHPELGATRTRADGFFDLAVNGGEDLTVRYDLDGYIPAQRQAHVPWQDYITIDTAILVRYDAKVTEITLGAAPQVARGSVSKDSDGTRQATVLFPGGTQASLRLPDGSTRAVPVLHVRATEFTVGDGGPRAMPASLPKGSGYTYAVELSADEARGQGELRFSQPVPFYVENFLNFPIGGLVPAGYHDRDRGVWVAYPNGRVIKVLGGSPLADLDLDGDGKADSAAALAAQGINDDERRTLSTLYPAGQGLWRVPLPHFTPIDCNWPYGPDKNARPPQNPPPQSKQPSDDPCKKSGSVIECQNQILGERLSVVGTPLGLVYRSDRGPGRGELYSLDIPLTGPTLPPGLKGVTLSMSVGGQVVEKTFPALPGQRTALVWDQRDVYGRLTQGRQPVRISTGYVYDAVYQQPAERAQVFGALSGVPISGDRTRQQVTLSQEWQDDLAPVGNFDVAAEGLGGWTLDVHHVYDPTGRVLHLGNGDRRSAQAINAVIDLVAGGDLSGFTGDGGRADQARLNQGAGVAVAPDGTVYLADRFNSRVRRIGLDRVITTFAGSDTAGYAGDGGPATAAQLNQPTGLSLGPDGSLYIADTLNSRVRRVAPDGTISTVVGTGVRGFAGDGGPATAAQLDRPQAVAVSADGSLYVADSRNARVRRVAPDGLIDTLAGGGDGTSGDTPYGDGGPARRSVLGVPLALALGADGAVYIADGNYGCIRAVRKTGLIETVAGVCRPMAGFTGEGGPATEADLNSPQGLAVGPDGSLYFAEYNRVGRILPDGTLVTMAGGNLGSYSSSAPARYGRLAGVTGLSWGPDGGLYVADSTHLSRVNPALRGFTATELILPSSDGREIYVFDQRGRHLRTVDAATLLLRYRFGYDAGGYLTDITDGSGNVTRVERGDQGRATAIVSPYGQRTALVLDAAGYLSRYTNPAGEAQSFVYDGRGLLTELRDARGGVHKFAYDANGRVVRDDDPAGGSQALAYAETAKGFQVDVTTALGQKSRYLTELDPTGTQHLRVTAPGGEQTDTLAEADGSASILYAGGATLDSISGPDPRFGMQLALPLQVTATLPSGLQVVQGLSRSAALAIPDDPLSQKTLTDKLSVNGRVLTTVTDVPARTVTQTTPVGRKTVASADDHGRLSALQLPGQPLIEFSYDARGRIASIKRGARTRSGTYDSRGFVASVTDELGQTVQLERDAAGRLTRQVLPDGRAISYTRDADGNITSLTPPSRPAHALRYTATGRLSDVTPPDLGAGPTPTRYAYDLDGRLLRVTRADGRVLDLTYQSGRLSQVTQAGVGAVALEYDDGGHLKAVTAPDGAQVRYTRDGGLPTAVAYTGAVAGSVERTYDRDLRVASESVNGGGAISLQYDQDGLLSQAGALALTHDLQSGLITAVQLGDVQSALGFNSYAELTSDRATYKGATLWAQERVLDALGRMVKSTETAQGTTHVYEYTYDVGYRLAQVKQDGALTAEYSYDGNSNRVQRSSPGGDRSATYDQQDRLLTYGALQYSYGATGELQKKTDRVTLKSTTYAHDLLGNLRAVTLPDGRVIDYVIDGNQRRIGKKVGGALLQGWLYGDMARVVAEVSGAGAVVSRFVYASRGHVPDYLIKGGATYRILTDHRGSPRLVVDVATGAVAQRLEYDEFGRVLTDTSPGFQPFGFAGGLYDADTGLVRFGRRDYDAEAGRWIAPDPLGFAGGDANLYGYVMSDPLNHVDPSGLLGIGYIASVTAEGGFGPGTGANASLGVGLFDNGLGGFASFGAVSGYGDRGLRYPGWDPSNPDTQQGVGVIGAVLPLGVSQGVFLTNARCAKEMEGPSRTYSLNLPAVSVQFGYGSSGIFQLSITAGPSIGASVSSYPTNTWVDR